MRSWLVSLLFGPRFCRKRLLTDLSTVLRNPVYFLLLALLGIGAYVVWYTNTASPLLNMASAASQQALKEGKVRLRQFLEETDAGRQALGMPPATRHEAHEMS